MAEARRLLPWVPNPGPQSLAYLSDAHELYYGGAAGGGKTMLLIGLAATGHRDSLILRRTSVDTKAISKALKALNHGDWRSSGYGGELRTPDGRTVEVSGCQHEDDKDKYQGQPHDGIFFDELPQFSESQYTFIIGWNRPANPKRYPGQRCRVVGAGNPPTTPEGEWVLRRWRAWIDPASAGKARPGELRWYTTINGEEEEVPDGSPVVRGGTVYTPRSRTFIPARLEDNPDLLETGYAATLESMPEPYRSMLRHGDMLAARQDDRWQLIPTKWVAAAQRRWVERMKTPGECTRIGCDVAMEGQDWTVVARRHEQAKVVKLPDGGERTEHHSPTIGQLVKRRGKDTPDGQSVVALLLAAGTGTVKTNVDAIGIGKSAVDVAKMTGLSLVNPVVVSKATSYRDRRVPALKFVNTRSAMMWHVRALLDPEGGPEDTRLALPPDPELMADLCAPRHELRSAGIAVESKDDIKKRIGRSTDSGDAVALACWDAGPVLLVS